MKKKNYINFIFFLLIFIIILFTVLAKPLNDLDEMWNYNIARNISDGLIPYKDISMITTPLLSIITAIFLKLITNELIITRILSAVLATLILYSLYRTMKILKINTILKYLVITILLWILKNYFCLDYNWFVALIGITILNLELNNLQKKKENTKLNLKYEFFIGCLAGISICIKQSIGGLIAIAVIIYNLVFLKSKIDFKKYIKITFIRICGIILPFLILLIYLYINGALYNFIDYCILGIKTFSNSISYTTLINSNYIILKVMSILMPIMYLMIGFILITNLSKKKDISILFTMFIYSIVLFAITFPICDDIHFLIGTLPSMILLIYLTYMILKHTKLYWHKIYNILKIAIGILVFALLANAISMYNTSIKINMICKDLNHFKYIPISEDLYNSVKEIDEYILSKESKVYVLDANAVIYMIPLNRYNKDYDMFNLGNFGSRGEDGKIEDLKNEDNIIILLRNSSFAVNWQHPQNVRKYIETNWIKTDMIQFLDVYEKGN